MNIIVGILNVSFTVSKITRKSSMNCREIFRSSFPRTKRLNVEGIFVRLYGASSVYGSYSLISASTVFLYLKSRLLITKSYFFQFVDISQVYRIYEI